MTKRYVYSSYYNTNRKLDDTDIIEIRRLYHDENQSVYSLAREFNVSDFTIRMAIGGIHYKDVNNFVDNRQF